MALNRAKSRASLSRLLDPYLERGFVPREPGEIQRLLGMQGSRFTLDEIEWWIRDEIEAGDLMEAQLGPEDVVFGPEQIVENAKPILTIPPGGRPRRSSDVQRKREQKRQAVAERKAELASERREQINAEKKALQQRENEREQAQARLRQAKEESGQDAAQKDAARKSAEEAIRAHQRATVPVARNMLLGAMPTVGTGLRPAQIEIKSEAIASSTASTEELSIETSPVIVSVPQARSRTQDNSAAFRLSVLRQQAATELAMHEEEQREGQERKPASPQPAARQSLSASAASRRVAASEFAILEDVTPAEIEEPTEGGASTPGRALAHSSESDAEVVREIARDVEHERLVLWKVGTVVLFVLFVGLFRECLLRILASH